MQRRLTGRRRHRAARTWPLGRVRLVLQVEERLDWTTCDWRDMDMQNHTRLAWRDAKVEDLPNADIQPEP